VKEKKKRKRETWIERVRATDIIVPVERFKWNSTVREQGEQLFSASRGLERSVIKNKKKERRGESEMR
jgi:hypothetical protein